MFRHGGEGATTVSTLNHVVSMLSDGLLGVEDPGIQSFCAMLPTEGDQKDRSPQSARTAGIAGVDNLRFIPIGTPPDALNAPECAWYES